MTFDSLSSKIYNAVNTINKGINLKIMKPLHILTGIETYGEEFPQKVPVLIQELAIALNIEIDKLDKSEDSLTLIDLYFFNNTDTIDEAFLNANIMRLEAYQGEIFMKKYGGEWKVEYNREFDIYVPFISLNSYKISFYFDTLKGFLEGEPFDIKWLFKFNTPREIRK